MHRFAAILKISTVHVINCITYIFVRSILFQPLYNTNNKIMSWFGGSKKKEEPIPEVHHYVDDDDANDFHDPSFNSSR